MEAGAELEEGSHSPVDIDRARLGSDCAGNQCHHCAFPGTVRTNDAYRFALPDLEADIIQREKGLDPQPPDQIGQVKERLLESLREVPVPRIRFRHMIETDGTHTSSPKRGDSSR